MGREVRMVPPGWEHPKDEQGEYIPMLEEVPYNEEEIAEGLEEGWLIAGEPFYGLSVMPQWPPEERTQYMMYEDCTDGTPISPAFDTAEELAHWLADTGASAFASSTATYDAWFMAIERKWSPSFVIMAGVIDSGVSAMAERDEAGA